MFAKMECGLIVAMLVIVAAVGTWTFAEDPRATKTEVAPVPNVEWGSISMEGDPESNVSVPVDARGLFQRIEPAGGEKWVRYQLQVADSKLEMQPDTISIDAGLKPLSPVHVAGLLTSLPLDAAQPNRKHLVCIAKQITPLKSSEVNLAKSSDWASINLSVSVPIIAQGTYVRPDRPDPAISARGLPHRVRAVGITLEIDPIALSGPSQSLLLGDTLKPGTPVEVCGELSSQPFDAGQPNRKRLVCMATQFRVLTNPDDVGTSESINANSIKASSAGVPGRQKGPTGPPGDQANRGRTLEESINAGRGLRALLRADVPHEEIVRVVQAFQKAGYKVDVNTPGLLFADLPQGQKVDPRLIATLQSISRDKKVFPKPVAGTAPWVQIPYGERPSRIESGKPDGAAAQPPPAKAQSQSLERPSLVEKGSQSLR
ncbi:MAG TPA: hypothetical protein VJY33_08885 [Isosphaeraceae bacterium]|nr:hypothetical protein [Isosphaeraceae bacterium]